MTVGTVLRGTTPSTPTAPCASNRAFAGTLFALAAALIANTVLGPLVTGVIEYPISGSLLNQVIGLEVVSVGLVVPITVIAGALALHGHRAAALLGFGPAAYTGYMFLQYVVGPEYSTYTVVAFFHMAIFTLSCAIAVWAWSLGSRQPLPQLTVRRRRLYGAILLLLAAFILTRYLGAVAGSVAGGPLPVEFAAARTFYWSIFLLDLGVVVPATVAAGIGLFRDARAAHTALYAVMIWYALVPPSVAAMSATMVINGDPYAAPSQTLLLVLVSVVFAVLAAWVYSPLLRTPSGSPITRGG